MDETQDFSDSEAVCNPEVLSVSRSEMAEGKQRATVFLAEHPSIHRGGR
jgi:hypothetical protein